MPQSRAEKIKLVLFDVDGVLTDGTILLLPAPAADEPRPFSVRRTIEGPGFGIVSRDVIEAKGFHAHDGTAISLARLGGLKTGVITKRISETVALRGRDLKLDHVRQGIQDKWSTFQEILAAEQLTPEQAAFVGDDIIDLPIMRRCGLAIAVANARPEVKRDAHFVTEHRGGEGAARDAIEFILKAQGSLERVLEEYIAGVR